jgi:hypothetical protein
MQIKGMSTGGLIAIAMAGLFLTVLTSGLITASKTVPTTGTVTAINVGVYSDLAFTQECTSINWGTISPGNQITRTVYIKNTGTVPATLTMTTASWVPSNANTYLTLNWNRQDYALGVGASVPAILTLTVSSNTAGITNFSFNIVITGTN